MNQRSKIGGTASVLPAFVVVEPARGERELTIRFVGWTEREAEEQAAAIATTAIGSNWDYVGLLARWRRRRHRFGRLVRVLDLKTHTDRVHVPNFVEIHEVGIPRVMDGGKLLMPLRA